MNTIHDEAREMLRGHMTRALGRVIAGLDALDELPKIAGRMADRDDWNELDESVQDLLVDLGIEPDSEHGEWDHDAALERVREDLDPLSITYEKGEPFDVALTIGGPNIYLVDFGGHGGVQLRGAWGSGWETMTGPDVTRAVGYYLKEARDIYGE